MIIESEVCPKASKITTKVDDKVDNILSLASYVNGTQKGKVQVLKCLDEQLKQVIPSDIISSETTSTPQNMLLILPKKYYERKHLLC